jgi:hypothetical protein
MAEAPAAAPAAKPAAETIELKIVAPSEHPMGWMEYTSSMAQSLGWPIAAVAIVVLFRHQLTALVKNIKRLKWGGASVDFADRLDRLEENTPPEALPRSAKPEQPKPADLDRFQALVAISPDSAVLDAWRPIEAVLDQLADYYYPTERRGSVLSSIKRLSDRGVLSGQTTAFLRELRMLRNVAAHDGSVTAADAFRFKQVADEIQQVLQHQLANAPAQATI